MNREVTKLWAESIGAPGTVIRYGHYGRAAAVLVDPWHDLLGDPGLVTSMPQGPFFERDLGVRP